MNFSSHIFQNFYLDLQMPPKKRKIEQVDQIVPELELEPENPNKKIATVEIAREVFRKRINDALYIITGCKYEESVKIVDHIETHLLFYLKKTRISSNKHKGQRKKAKTVNPEDMYAALANTPEYYGAKKCIILKKFSRKAEAVEDIDINIDEDLDVVSEEKPDDTEEIIPDPPDLLSELAKLNDGSIEYARFERDRLANMKHADELTKVMGKDEYLAYVKMANKKFIKRKDLFCLWTDWNPKPSEEVFIMLGWLSVNKIRSIIRKALKKRRETYTPTLFSPSTSEYDKTVPLKYKYFLNEAKYEKAIQEEHSDLLNFYNEKFNEKKSKSKKNIFDHIGHLRQTSMKKKEAELEEIENKKILRKERRKQQFIESKRQKKMFLMAQLNSVHQKLSQLRDMQIRNNIHEYHPHYVRLIALSQENSNSRMKIMIQLQNLQQESDQFEQEQILKDQSKQTSHQVYSFLSPSQIIESLSPREIDPSSPSILSSHPPVSLLSSMNIF